jgi:hypothetical protein
MPEAKKETQEREKQGLASEQIQGQLNSHKGENQ